MGDGGTPNSPRFLGWLRGKENEFSDTIRKIVQHSIVVLMALACEAVVLFAAQHLTAGWLRECVEAILHWAMLLTIGLYCFDFVCLLMLGVIREVKSHFSREGFGNTILGLVIFLALSGVAAALVPRLLPAGHKETAQVQARKREAPAPVLPVAMLQLEPVQRRESVPVFRWQAGVAWLEVKFLVPVRRGYRYYCRLDDRDLRGLPFDESGFMEETFSRAWLDEGKHRVRVYEQKDGSDEILRIQVFPFEVVRAN